MSAVKLYSSPLPKDQPIGLTKLFGDPDIPADIEFDWPSIIDEDDIYDLSFVLQLVLSDISHPLLPQKGMLYLFYDMDASAFSPYDTEACRAVFIPDEDIDSLEPLCLEDEDGKSLAMRSYKLSKEDNGSDCQAVLFPEVDAPAPIEGWTALISVKSVRTSPFDSNGELTFFIEKDKLEKADFSDIRILLKTE